MVPVKNYVLFHQEPEPEPAPGRKFPEPEPHQNRPAPKPWYFLEVDLFQVLPALYSFGLMENIYTVM